MLVNVPRWGGGSGRRLHRGRQSGRQEHARISKEPIGRRHHGLEAPSTQVEYDHHGVGCGRSYISN